jgi:hypothetical protein
MVTWKRGEQPSSEEKNKEDQEVRLVEQNHDPFEILIFLLPDFYHCISPDSASRVITVKVKHQIVRWVIRPNRSITVDSDFISTITLFFSFSSKMKNRRY